MGMSLDNDMYSTNTQIWSQCDRIQTIACALLSSSEVPSPVAKSANSMSCYDVGFYTIGSSMCNRPDLSNLEASTPRLVCSMVQG